MNRRVATLGSLLAFVLGGCSPLYGDLRLDRIAGDGEVSGNTIEVEEGRAVVIRVRPLASGVRGYEEFDVVDLESLNSSVVFVEGAREVDQFVVGGVGVGDTQIVVSINGVEEDDILATVTPQEEP